MQTGVARRAEPLPQSRVVLRRVRMAPRPERSDEDDAFDALGVGHRIEHREPRTPRVAEERYSVEIQQRAERLQVAHVLVRCDYGKIRDRA